MLSGTGTGYFVSGKIPARRISDRMVSGSSFFDILPGQERKIKILGNKTWGEIRIKPRYGDEQVFYWKGDGSFGENRFK